MYSSYCGYDMSFFCVKTNKIFIMEKSKKDIWDIVIPILVALLGLIGINFDKIVSFITTNNDLLSLVQNITTKPIIKGGESVPTKPDESSQQSEFQSVRVNDNGSPNTMPNKQEFVPDNLTKPDESNQLSKFQSIRVK